MRGDRTKEKGSVGELRVMYEAAKRGYGVLIPHGDFAKYDLVVDRNGKLEKVQVKAVTPVGDRLEVHTRSMGVDKTQDTNNRSKQNKYAAGDFDWLAVYDLANHNVYFVPAIEIFGRSSYTLRLSTKTATKTSRLAENYTAW
jgi:hypothetical protein